MPTYKELKVQIAELAERAEAARVAELHRVIDDIRSAIVEYGLTEKDIFGNRRGRPRKQEAPAIMPPPPKYRDPATGATWSGRGRAPRWIRSVESRESFLIGD